MRDDVQRSRLPWWTPYLILLIAIALRLYRLDSVPPPINPDEAVHAYDARCLLAVGKDHYGERWPVFFRAFRDYHPGPFIYLLMPLQALFGMNVWTTRLPAALMGSFGVWLLYQLIRRLYNDRAAALAAIFLAVSPWHLHITRLAFEASICPTLVVLAILLLVLAARRRDASFNAPARPSEMALWLTSGLTFGLVSWTYHAMRVFIPLLLAGLTVNYFSRLRLYLGARPFRRPGVAWIAGLVIGLGPFLWTWARHPNEVWLRASKVSVFHQTSGLAATATCLIQNYAKNFSPSFFFVEGDRSLIQSVDGYGQLHYYCVVLIPLGLWRAIRRWREEPFTRLVVWWILVSPIPASLAIWDSGHCLRSIGGLPAYQILAALGADLVLAAALRRSEMLYRRCIVVGALIVALNVAYFLRIFFVDYPVAAYEKFQCEWRDVFAEIERRKADYDAVLLTTRHTNQLGILYLFWTRMPPEEYFAQSPSFLPGPEFERLLQIGPVIFAWSEELTQTLPMLVHHRNLLVAERPQIPVPGRELRRFSYPDGRDAVILYEVRAEDIPIPTTTRVSPR
jgi:4-amino-4-deoxy-L-arabinose transferase-like glycosyltransferase